jgi:ABC-type sugar transport system ATPase subunit
LRLVAGLERPDAGDVFIAGTRVTHLEPRARDVAMVFQSYALYPHLTVEENIGVALRLRGQSRSEVAARIGRAAGRLGLAGLLARYPRALSGGERQRVALARALVREPRLFLLDEPLSNLDALLREQARAELKMLFGQIDATVVYVTHDQIEALTLASRLAVMQQGRIAQIGTPADIYERPATLFVAGFVGSPCMNLLPGTALGDTAHTVGVRPEHVRIGPGGSLRLQVALREPLGAQVLMTLRRDEPPLTIRALVPTEAPAARAGDTIGIAIDPAHMHRFDASGERL